MGVRCPAPRLWRAISDLRRDGRTHAACRTHGTRGDCRVAEPEAEPEEAEPEAPFSDLAHSHCGFAARGVYIE